MPERRRRPRIRAAYRRAAAKRRGRAAAVAEAERSHAFFHHVEHEMRLVMREHSLGASLPDALGHFAERAPGPHER